VAPPVSLLRQIDTHRLVPSRHLPRGDSVLVPIADDDEHLQAIFELDTATNERVLAEQQRLPGIGLEELVFAVPHASVINASFCHAHPLGSRFNGPDRGAWYAAFAVATAQTEVAFHKTVQLAEINRFHDSVTYDDYLADFTASFHDLRRTRSHRDCLDATSYVRSQALAEQLLAAGSLGIVYPSVRHRGGTCLVCFRPALVSNVRRGTTYRFTWDGSPTPQVR
jgi:RES domain-containing protein